MGERTLIVCLKPVSAELSSAPGSLDGLPSRSSVMQKTNKGIIDSFAPGSFDARASKSLAWLPAFNASGDVRRLCSGNARECRCPLGYLHATSVAFTYAVSASYAHGLLHGLTWSLSCMREDCGGKRSGKFPPPENLGSPLLA